MSSLSPIITFIRSKRLIFSSLVAVAASLVFVGVASAAPLERAPRPAPAPQVEADQSFRLGFTFAQRRLPNGQLRVPMAAYSSSDAAWHFDFRDAEFPADIQHEVPTTVEVTFNDGRIFTLARDEVDVPRRSARLWVEELNGTLRRPAVRPSDLIAFIAQADDFNAPPQHRVFDRLVPAVWREQVRPQINLAFADAVRPLALDLPPLHPALFRGVADNEPARGVRPPLDRGAAAGRHAHELPVQDFRPPLDRGVPVALDHFDGLYLVPPRLARAFAGPAEGEPRWMLRAVNNDQGGDDEREAIQPPLPRLRREPRIDEPGRAVINDMDEPAQRAEIARRDGVYQDVDVDGRDDARDDGPALPHFVRAMALGNLDVVRPMPIPMPMPGPIAAALAAPAEANAPLGQANAPMGAAVDPAAAQNEEPAEAGPFLPVDPAAAPVIHEVPLAPNGAPRIWKRRGAVPFLNFDPNAHRER